MKANSCPSKTLYVGLSLLSSMVSDWRRVKELLLWLVTWRRLWEYQIITSGSSKLIQCKKNQPCYACKVYDDFKNTGHGVAKQLSGINPCIPLTWSSKLDIFVTNHFQVRWCWHTAKEDGLTHCVRYHFCFRCWFTGCNITQYEIMSLLV